MTVPYDNFGPHGGWDGSTVPTNEGNYADNIKNTIAFLKKRKYIRASSLTNIDDFPENTSEYVKMPSWDRPKPGVSFAALVSVIVILGAIVGQFIDPESALLPTIAALGLALLATIVLTRQQQ